MTVKNKKLSPLALGTATFGGGIPETTAFALIDTYRELGGNVLDTARVYGESESVIGRYLESRVCRDKLIIATKGGHYDLVTKEKRINRRDISLDVETSLKSLKTDYVDIYFLHRDDESVPVEEIMDILASLVREGKILSVGVSNWNPERIRAANTFAYAHNLPRIIANQIKHSAAVTVSESDPTMLSLDESSRQCCEDEKITVFAYTSQAKGLFSKLERLGADGISDGLKREFICDETLRRYTEIQKLSRELDRPISQVALATLLCDPTLNIIPIIGGKKPEQIIDSLAAAQIDLSPKQYNKIMKG